MAQQIKNLPVMQETQEMWVQSLGWEGFPGGGNATHSSILVWEIPWTEERGGLQSEESQRVQHGRMERSPETEFRDTPTLKSDRRGQVNKIDQGVTMRQKKTWNVCPGSHRGSEWYNGSSAAAWSKKTKTEMGRGRWIQHYWRWSLRTWNSFSGSVRVKPWQEWVQNKRKKRNQGQQSFQGGSLPRETWETS